jgi:hypothetical protein
VALRRCPEVKKGYKAKTRRCLSQAVREFAQALDVPREDLTAEPSRECREAPFRNQT